MPSPLLIEDETEIAEIVRGANVVAVVGMKDGVDPHAPAYSVPVILKARGMQIIPVNPKFDTILGEKVYARVADVPLRPDILDVFRRPEVVEALADEVLAMPKDRYPRVFWMQSGIRNEAAAAKLTAAGIRVVQDHCLGVYANRYRRS